MKSLEEYNYLTRRCKYAYEFRKTLAPKRYCFCMQTDDGSCMVYCELCEDWFHTRCVGNIKHDVFLCNRCTKGDGNLYIRNAEYQSKYFRQQPPTSKIIEKESFKFSSTTKKRSWYQRVTSQQNHCKYSRLEIIDDMKPWSVVCMESHPKFIVGGSDASLQIYSITPSTTPFQSILPDCTQSDSDDLGAEKIHSLQTGHSFGFSNLILQNDEKIISSNWVDGTLIVSLNIDSFSNNNFSVLIFVLNAKFGHWKNIIFLFVLLIILIM